MQVKEQQLELLQFMAKATFGAYFAKMPIFVSFDLVYENKLDIFDN